MRRVQSRWVFRYPTWRPAAYDGRVRLRRGVSVPVGSEPSAPVAYLLSLYPSPTHTFIRREIEAVERQGIPVLRFTIRRFSDDPVHLEAAREIAQARAVLDSGIVRIALEVVRRALASPGRFAIALRTAVRLGRGAPRGIAVHLVYLAEACVVRRWAADSGVRHIHAHFGTNTAAVAMLCHSLGGPPYSFTVHGPEEFDHPRELKLREKMAGAAFVAAITDFARSQLYRWIRTEDWDRVHVVRCGLDQTYLGRQHETVPDVARFVSIGRLDSQKGQLLLIEAAAALLDEGRRFELVLIGDGPLRKTLESTIARLGYSDAIRLLGWQGNEVVATEVLRSRAVVLPSFAEGLPVVLMEALALGRPVISTAIAGIPELVETGVVGWLIRPGSVPALVDAMRAALDTPVGALDKMGRAGAIRVRANHDVDQAAAALARLFAGASRDVGGVDTCAG